MTFVARIQPAGQTHACIRTFMTSGVFGDADVAGIEHYREQVQLVARMLTAATATQIKEAAYLQCVTTSTGYHEDRETAASSIEAPIVLCL